MSAPPPPLPPGVLPPIPPNIAAISASQLFGSLFNFTLYGVLAVQVYIYRISFPKDNLTIKYLVYFVFAYETVTTVMNGVDIFQWFSAGFGNVLNFADPRLSVWYTPVMGSLMALIVQGFFCYRIFIINRSSWWWCILIGAVSLLQAIAGIVGGVEAHIANNVGKRANETVLVYLWLVGDAVADIMIASTMTYNLLKSSSNQHRQTNDIVNRIIRLTVETNALSASIALIGLILFAGLPNTTYFICPTIVLGKIYANTLLVTFNNRAFLHRKPTGSSGAPADSSYENWSQGQSTRTLPFSAGLSFSENKSGGGVTITSQTDRTIVNDISLDHLERDVRDKPVRL